MPEDIKSWLERLALGKYVELFIDNDIDMDALPYITEEDLREIGIKVGARRKILATLDSERTTTEKMKTGSVDAHRQPVGGCRREARNGAS